jgi:hypothetical protein
MRSTAHWRGLLCSSLAAALVGVSAGIAVSAPAEAALQPATPGRGPDRIDIVAPNRGPGAAAPAGATAIPVRRLRQPSQPPSSRPAVTGDVALKTAAPAKTPQAVVAANQPGLAATIDSPSDSTGAIGPNHYIETVNVGVGLFDRNLVPISTTDLGTFIGLAAGDAPADPQIQWDQQGGRWLYSALEVNGTANGNNFLDFGWSKAGDPSALTLNSSDWCSFKQPTMQPLADFDKLGHDANFILIGANVFSGNTSSATFQTAGVFAIPKPAAGDTTCAPATVFQFGSATLPLVYPGTNSLVFTPVPSNTADSSSTGYIVSTDVFSLSSIGIFHVAPASACGMSSPCLIGDGNVAISQWSAPPSSSDWTVAQPSGPTLDALDGRLTQAVQVADPTVTGNNEAVWTQHTSGVSSAPDARTVVTWYELLPGLCATPTCPASAKRQEGVITDPNLSAFNGAVSPDHTGQNAIVQYNTGSASSLVAVAAQDRNASQPLNLTFASAVLGTSTVTDTDISCRPPAGPPCRWGDYSGASPDPSVPDGVWGTNMLAGTMQSTGLPTWTTRNFDLRRWESLAGQLTPNSGPAAASWDASRMDAFAEGAAGDLQHAANAGSGWSRWESLGGGLTAAPGAVSWAPNRIDAVGRGLDGQMWHISWNGTNWSGWEPLGGGLIGAPDIASWAPNRLDAFVEGTDRELWHQSWDGTRWSGWEPLGGVLNSGPGVVSWSANRIDVFVSGSDNQLNHKSWDGTQWSAWEPLGGVLASAPHVASCGVGQLDVVALGTNQAVYRLSYNGAWSGWRLVGATWTGQPAAVCRPSLGLNIFTQGTDNAVWHAAIS